MERKKTKLAAVIAWCANAAVWCALFSLAVYYHQRLWIVLLYAANGVLGLFTAGMYVLQYWQERKN